MLDLQYCSLVGKFNIFQVLTYIIDDSYFGERVHNLNHLHYRIIFRCWYTLKRFQEQEKITDEVKGKSQDVDVSELNKKISKLARWISGRNLLAAYLISGLIWIILLVGLSFAAGDFWNTNLVLNTLNDECGLNGMRYITPSIAALYAILMFVYAIKMRKVKVS